MGGTGNTVAVTRAYARTFVAGIVCVTCTLGALWTASGTAGAGAAEEPVGNGIAQATASIMRIAPGVGSLQIAMTSGTTVAHIANNLAESQAQTLDLGLIGTSLTVEDCEGNPGPVKPEQLPQPLTVDNRHGDASATGDEVPMGGSSLGGGHKEVEATSAPAAHAAATGVVGTLGPLLSISGGHSDSATRVDPGHGREAEASVSVDLDIAGVVQLQGLRWRAFHRTGDDPAADASFSLDGTQALGVPLPIDQLAPLQDAVNKALELSGVSVELPRVEHITEPKDIIRVTPLRVILKDSPLGKTLLGPGLNLTRPQREQLFDAIVAQVCRAAGILLVGDVTLSVASGTGFLIVDIGGAQATSSDLDFEDPFGSIAPLTPVVGNLNAAGVGTSRSAAPAAAPAAQPAAPPTQTIRESGPIETVCETLSPAKRPGCSLGAGLPIAVLGIGLTGAMAVLDWRHQRRLLKAAETPA